MSRSSKKTQNFTNWLPFIFWTISLIRWIHCLESINFPVRRNSLVGPFVKKFSSFWPGWISGYWWLVRYSWYTYSQYRISQSTRNILIWIHTKNIPNVHIKWVQHTIFEALQRAAKFFKNNLRSVNFNFTYLIPTAKSFRQGFSESCVELNTNIPFYLTRKRQTCKSKCPSIHSCSLTKQSILKTKREYKTN